MNKRRMTLLAGCLALNAVGLALVLYYAGPTSATAAAAPEGGGTKTEEAAPKIAASKITHVTIYPDSALVTREVEVPPGAGLAELIVSPLPETVVNTSLYSEPSEGVRVLTTHFRSRPVREDTREEVRRVEDEIKKLKLTQEKTQSDILALEGNMMFLGKLEEFTKASTTNATEKGKLDSETVIVLAKYLMENRTDKAKALIELRHQQQETAERLAFAQRKLGNLTAGTSRTERDAVVVVEKMNNAGGKVRLNYLVKEAAWRPQYKFRAGATPKDAVVVEYLAAVMQQTGEDWSRVTLTLSTAQPMLNAAPPDLQMLAVAVVPRGQPMPGVALNRTQLGGQIGGLQFGGGGFNVGGGPGMMGGGGRAMGGPGQPMATLSLPAPAFANPKGTVTATELNAAIKDLRQQAQIVNNDRQEGLANQVTNYAAALEQARDLVLATEGKDKSAKAGRETRNEGPSVTYHLKTRLSVPSRSDEQVLEVCKLEMVPSYFYKAIPVLSSHVYRQADLTNKSEHVLLPGEATMYHGTDFVGRMLLPLVAVGEQFTVGFGTEPQLQVVRQMMDKSRAMQGGNQILKFEYRILVSSYKAEKVRVQVWDRLPHAENEQLGVSLVKTAPALCADPVYLREERPNNLLRWDLEVEPGARGEKAERIAYEFKLELDRQATIGSFQNR